MMVLLHDVPKNTSGCCGDPVLNEANAKEYDRNVLRCQRNSAGVPHGTAFIDVYNTISRYINETSKVHITVPTCARELPP